MWRVVFLALSLLAGADLPARAQAASASAPGELQAVSYHEVPAVLSLSVSLFDNSDLDLKIRDSAIAALERARHEVGDGRAFELELSSESETGGLTGPSPSLGRAYRNDEDSRIEMNIWSSTQDSLIGGRSSDGARLTSGSFAIRATLWDRSGGRVVWEGRASVDVERNQASAYVSPMVEALVESLGRTVRQGSFPVP